MIQIKTSGSLTIARLSGELDHHSARMMRTEIDRELSEKHPTRLVLDFSAVTFMDSSGIGLIMGRYKIMNGYGGNIIIAAPPAYIKKVLHLAGIDRLAAITDNFTEKEADDIEQTTPQTT